MEEELEERRSLAQGSRLNSREGPQENIALPSGGFWGGMHLPCGISGTRLFLDGGN